MDLTHSLLDAIWRPSFVFTYELTKRRTEKASPESASPVWDTSALNPKNRIDSLDTGNLRWRIDGATICGTRFFCVPKCLMPNLMPLRIDVFIPDQGDHPTNLREVLDSSASVTLRHAQAIGNLGISRHLCRALDNHCERNPSFLDDYQKLPFGSKLVFENVSADTSKMELTVVPTHDLERQSLSVASLRKAWEGHLTECAWPNVIDLTRLNLVRQLHDSVSIVSILESNYSQDLIFKSNTSDFNHLYHELKFLLTIPPHANVIPRPLHIITKKCRFGGKHGVIGFTLPYYPLGSIRDELALRTQNRNLSFKQQLKWSRQITSALVHIHEKAGTFYSDLRPDNVLLVASSSKDGEDVILCDFEQRGNWHEWCAPEVLYRQYIYNLSSNLLSRTSPKAWRDLIDTYLPAPPSAVHQRAIDPAVLAKNPAWFLLSPTAAEKATVYSLGLLLYCLFEGLSNVRVSVANAYPIDPDVEFPEFKRTPSAIRDVIRRCTAGAPEWEDEQDEQYGKSNPNRRARRVVRRGSKLYPEGMTDIDLRCRCEEEVANLVLDTAMEWWTTELERAEDFLESEEWKTGEFGRERPTLREVLRMLEHIAKEML